MRDRIIGNSFEDMRLDATMALKIEVEDGREEVGRVKSEGWEKLLKIPLAAREDAVCLGLLLLGKNDISYSEEDIGVGFSGGGRSKTRLGDCYTATTGYYYYSKIPIKQELE
ncbi:hypothetical protein HN51_039409 [Arachis hypogaea]